MSELAAALLAGFATTALTVAGTMWRARRSGVDAQVSLVGSAEKIVDMQWETIDRLKAERDEFRHRLHQITTKENP